jgi:hypothetical protein
MTITDEQFSELIDRAFYIKAKIEEHSGYFLTEEDIDPILDVLDKLAAQSKYFAPPPEQ